MRDIDCDLSIQHYQDLLREAEPYRFAGELGFGEADTLRSIAAKLGAWLSRQTSGLRSALSDGLAVLREQMQQDRRIS